MSNHPRSYRDDQDLANMRQLLVAGKKANNGSYYVHPGDLDWWLHFLSQGGKREQTIFLWENSQKEYHLLGWTLLSPDWNAVDVFVHPDLHATCLAQHMWEWSINQLSALESTQQAQKLRTMWIDEHDPEVTGILENLGFQSSDEAMHYLECELQSRAASNIELPEGYMIRAIYGEKEVEKRAAVSHAAFESEKPFEQYVNRYLAFMRSPVYQPERDLVVVTPGGEFAGCCNLWLDDENKVGLFEPVGIHPQYQKRGLGKALMLAGLEKMNAFGMQKAMVCAEHTNTAAINLYQKVGFKPLKTLRTYTKRVNPQHSD